MGADVALLQTVAGLLVGLRNVDSSLRNTPEQFMADVALVAELLVKNSAFVTVPINENLI